MNKLPKKFVERVLASETQKNSQASKSHSQVITQFCLQGRNMLLKYIVAMSFFSFAGSVQAEVRDVRLETSYVEGSQIRDDLDRFVSYVNEVAADYIKISVYQYEGIAGLPSSGADLYLLPSSFFKTKIPSVESFSAPFLFDDYNKLVEYQSKIGRSILSDFDDVGFTGVGFFNGPMNILVGRKYTSVSDLSGQKIAVSGTQQESVVSLLGASPVRSDLLEFVPALIAGNVDSAVVPLQNVGFLKEAGANSLYVANTPLLPSVGLLVSARESWKSLPSAALAAIVEAIDFTTQTSLESLLSLEKSAYSDFASYGYEMNAINRSNNELIGTWNGILAGGGANFALSTIALVQEKNEEKIDRDREDKFPSEGSSASEVFFVTDRRDENQRDPRYAFAHVRGRESSFGVAELAVPEDRLFGQVGRIKSVAKLTESDLLNLMSERLLASGKKEINIYIHGYNTLFYQAIQSYHALDQDLLLEGIPVVFSWPSDGYALRYSSDSEEVFNSVNNLYVFLLKVSENIPEARINLIAHSMGSRLVFETLELAWQQKKVMKLGHVVAAAPDITIYRFEQMTFYKSPRDAKISVYMSAYDSALSCSRVLNDSIRLGQGGKDVSVYNGVLSIDASEVEIEPEWYQRILSGYFLCEAGHSYVTENRIVKSDISTAVKFDAHPSRRPGLKTEKKTGIVYWIMKRNE